MMKKVILLIFTILFSTSPVFAWGIPRCGNNVPYPGKEYEELIKNHNAFYIGDTNKKEVYLTFDTGYELGNTSVILDILRSENVKAAFFVTGHFLKQNKELVLRMYNEGHLVCNHTWNHPNITKKSKIEIEEDLCRVEDKYYEITHDYMPKFLRPPEGAISDYSLSVTDELGYTTIFWSLAYVDWKINEQKGSKYAYDNVINNIHNGAIILMHTVSTDNRDALKEIIATLRVNYEFKNLYDLVISL